MKKKSILILALLIVCIFFSGCYRAEVTVNVKRNAKFTITQQVMATTTYYELDGAKKVTSKTVYKKLKKQIQDNFKKSKKTLKLKKIKKKINGEQYYGYKVTGIKSSELKDGIKTYRKNGRVYVELDMTSYTSNEDESTPEEFSETIGLCKAGGMSMKFKLTFPHRPKTSFGSVKGRTATVNILNYMEKHPEGGKIVISSKI